MKEDKNVIARSENDEAISKDVIASPFDKLRARNDSFPNFLRDGSGPRSEKQ